MSYYGPVLAVIAVILLCEVVTRIIAGMLIAAVFGMLLPQGKGALAHLLLLPSYLALFLIIEFCFYWGHRLAYGGQRRPALRWLWKMHRPPCRQIYECAGDPAGQPVLVIRRADTPGGGPGHLSGAGEGGRSRRAHHLLLEPDHPRPSPLGRCYTAMARMEPSTAIMPSTSPLDWMFGRMPIPAGLPWRYGVPGPQQH